MAWFCVERIEPRKATMSGCAASFEKASTAPGLVVWSSSVTSSTCFPSTPPALFTRSSAIFAPVSEYLPESAAGPVTSSTMPILIVESSAQARRRIAGAARLAASPEFTDRLVSFMHSSRFLRHPTFSGRGVFEREGDPRGPAWQAESLLPLLRGKVAPWPVERRAFFRAPYGAG